MDTKIIYTPLSELDFDKRMLDAFNQLGFKVVKDLVIRSESELLKSNHISRKSLAMIKKVVEDDLGLKLGMNLGAF